MDISEFFKVVTAEEAALYKDEMGFARYAFPVTDKKGVKAFGEGAWFVSLDWLNMINVNRCENRGEC